MASRHETDGRWAGVVVQDALEGRAAAGQRPLSAHAVDQIRPLSPSDGCHFWVVLHLMRRMRPHYDRALAQVSLGAKQYNLLSQIQQVEPVTHRSLAASMALDPSTLGRNLQPLLAQQWVAVRPGADARTKLVSLTETGKAKLAEGHVQWQRANAQVGELLGAELTAGLHRVADRCLPRLGPAPGAATVEPIRKRP